MAERYQVALGPETRQFYDLVAREAGLPLEQVLSDALFKLAGELSLEALAQAEQTADRLGWME
mgnify:CR=1 FL=1